MSDSDFYTSEGDGAVGTIHTVEQARAAHHLASADPDGPDGTLTGPEHDAKYGLARAAGSRADWAGAHGGDPDGGRDTKGVQTAAAAPAPETADAPAPAPAVVAAPAPAAPAAA